MLSLSARLCGHADSRIGLCASCDSSFKAYRVWLRFETYEPQTETSSCSSRFPKMIFAITLIWDNWLVPGGSSDDVRFAQRQDAIRAMTDLQVVFIGILCTFTVRNVVPELSGMVEHKFTPNHFHPMCLGKGVAAPKGGSRRVMSQRVVPKKGGAPKGGSPDGHDRLWPIRF